MKFSKLISVAAAAAVAATVAAIPSSAEDTAYHAYIGVQSANFTFRNAWNEATYGKGITGDEGFEYFSTLVGWDGGSVPLDKGGEFTDAEITGDGTYTVSLSGDFDFGSDETLNLLFVSTDIPLDAGVTVSDVKVSFDGNVKYTFDEAFMNPDEKEYVNFQQINIWNPDLGGEDGLFGYTMPSDSISIEFTVSGLPAAEGGDDSADAEAAETEAAETEAAADTEAPASDSSSDNATTGNASAAAIAALMAASGAALVLSKKK